MKKTYYSWLHSNAEMLEFFKPEGLVLDLGCGSGNRSIYMLEKGLKVISLDIYYESLRKFKDERLGRFGNSIKNIDIIHANAMHLPFRSKSFDSVLCSWVLEHLTDPEQCLKEIHRILKRDGEAYFSTPTLNIPLKILIPIHRRLAGSDIKLAREEHKHVFSDKELFRILNPLFQIAHIKYTDFTTAMQYRIKVGYNFDRMLSAITERVPFLHFLAAGILIKVVKRVS